MRYNYTSRLLMQRKRRQDHLLASKWYYTLMFPKQESILFYMINTIRFLLTIIICGIMLPFTYLGSVLNNTYFSKAFTHSYETYSICNKRFIQSILIITILCYCGPIFTLYFTSNNLFSTITIIGTIMIFQLFLSRLIYKRMKLDPSLIIIKHHHRRKNTFTFKSISHICTAIVMMIQLGIIRKVKYL